MKIGKFISLVKERPVLFDSLHPLRKDRKEKEQMWREISTALNIHSDVAKNRWKSLKDCYTKYLKSTTSTGPAVYLKYSNWQWAEQMEFMKPHIKFGLIISNIELQDNHEIEDLATQSGSDVQGYQSSSEILGTHEKCEKSERSGSPDRFEKTDTHERSGNDDRSRLRKRSKTQEKTFEKLRRRQRPAMAPSEDTPPNTDSIIHYLDSKKTDSYSATELIFLGYARTIKTFSIRRQAEIKMKIAKVMMEEEIAHFEETVSHSQYHRNNF